MPESFSRFRTDLSDGFTFIMTPAPWVCVGKAVRRPLEARLKRDDRGLGVGCGEQVELLQILTQDAFDPADIDELKGQRTLKAASSRCQPPYFSPSRRSF